MQTTKLRKSSGHSMTLQLPLTFLIKKGQTPHHCRHLAACIRISIYRQPETIFPTLFPLFGAIMPFLYGAKHCQHPSTKPNPLNLQFYLFIIIYIYLHFTLSNVTECKVEFSCEFSLARHLESHRVSFPLHLMYYWLWYTFYVWTHLPLHLLSNLCYGLLPILFHLYYKLYCGVYILEHLEFAFHCIH